MSTTIDNKIVSMQFDNKHFEKNVQTSMGTLEKLKQSLNLKGASRGLESINSATNEVVKSEYEAYQSGLRLKDIWLKMSSIFEYQVAGRIISAAKNMTKAFTIDPIKTGLSEYETQLNSVQTILANTESKGSTLEDVNAALDELNAYADKTIYNFTEMTRNIGTFTAAGVELDTSVSAIKGIANLAAVSGSTSQQASTAMYQLSQALASGTVKLMDWNSVVNAGMGGQVFQDALKETARVHGVAIDDIIEKQGSFRESLSEGWLSSEILLETLNKFTGDLSEEQLKSMGYTEQQIEEIMKLGQTANDAATKVKTFTQLMDTLKEAAQSGWAQTWELLIGDFGEAKELWTNVSDVLGGIISDSVKARNELLSGALSSGWKQLMGEGIMDEDGYTHYLKETAKKHGVSLDEMIEKEGSLEKALRKGLQSGELSSEMFSESLSKLSEKYSGLSEEQLKNLGFTKEQVDELTKLNEQVQNGSISMGEFTDKIQKLSGRELIIESFKNVWEGLLSVAKPIKEAFTEIFPPATSEQLYKILEGIRNFTSHLKLNEQQSEKLKQTFKGLFAAIDIVFTVMKSIGSVIVKLIGSVVGLGNGVLGITGSFGDFLCNMRDSIKESNIFAKIANVLIKVITNITGAIKGFTSVLSKGFQTSGFEAFVNVIKTVWNVVKNIFGKIGELIGNTFTGDGNIGGVFFNALNAGLLTTLVIKFKGFVSSFQEIATGLGGLWGDIKGGITDIIGGVTDALSAFQDKLKSETIKNIAIALAILAGALLVMALIPENKLASALTAMTASMGILMGALTLIGKINGKSTKNIFSLIGMASALLILSFALKVLGSMEWDEIGKSLVAMTGALLIMIGALALTALVTKIGGNKAVKQLSTISRSLVILGVALKILASMSWEEIGRGLTAMSGALLVMTGVLALTSLISKIGGNKAARQIMGLSASLIILGAGLKLLATMSWEEIGRGLTAMSGALLIMTGVLALTALIGKIGGNKGASQLMAMSVSLIALGAGLKLLATMSWEEIGRGLTAMAGALLIMTGITALMAVISAKGGSAVKSAAAIFIMTSAIAALIPTLTILGNMKTETLVKGFIAIAAALTLFGVAAKLLTPVVPTLFAVSVSIALLGAACLAVGAGVALFSAGIATLVTAIVGGGTAIIATLVQMVREVSNLIPHILTKIGEGIVAFCEVIAQGAPAIGQALVAVLLSALEACVAVIPKLAEGMLQIILGLFNAMAQYTPQIVESVFNLLLNILESIGKYIPKLSQVGVDLFMTFFTSILDALKTVDSKQLLETVLSIGIIAGLIFLLGSISSMIPAAMVGVLGMGVVITELAGVLAAVGLLTKIPGLMDFIEKGGDLLEKIGTAIGQFIGGLAGGIAKGFTSSLPDMGTDLSNFMTNLKPFLDGLKGLDASMMSNTKTLVGSILAITGASLLESITSWITGESSMTKFATELVAFGAGLSGFAEEVEGINPETITAAAEAGKTLSEMAKTIPATGGLFQLFGGEHNLSDFASGIGDFGKGLADFNDEVKDVNPETITAAAKAGKTLAEMANKIPESGGLFQVFGGENNLSSFSTGISNFGEGLAKFAEKVKDVDASKIQSSISAGKSLAEMASSIPSSGGLWGMIIGGQDLGNFGVQLGFFGKGISSFAKSVQGVDLNMIGVAAEAGEKLAVMANKVPTTGGLWSLIKGDNGLAGFATQIKYFGEGIAAFTKKVADSEFTKVDGAVTAGTKLAEMAKKIPSAGGLFTPNKGVNNMSSFKKQITTFAEGLDGFCDKIKDAQFTNTDTAIKAGVKLIELAKKIPDVGVFDNKEGDMSTFKKQIVTFGEGIAGFADEIADKDFSNAITAADSGLKIAKLVSEISTLKFENVKTFSDKLSPLATSIEDFINKLSDVKTDTAVAICDEVGQLVSALSKVSADGIQAVINVFSSSRTIVASAATAAIQAAIDSISSKVSTFQAAGVAMMQNLHLGIVSGSSAVVSQIQLLIQNMISAISNESLYSAYRSTGLYCVLGFANGINENTFYAKAAATAMAQAALNAANEVFIVESPSKAFYQTGEYCAQGLTNALDDSRTKAYKAGYSLATYVQRGLEEAVNTTMTLIEHGVNLEPTIRPVLDLSNIRSGIGELNGMLGFTPSVGVMSQVSSISSTMNHNQNRGNDDVVSAIKGLEDTLENASGDTYNIGITNNADEEVRAAIKTLIRATTVGGRS